MRGGVLRPRHTKGSQYRHLEGRGGTTTNVLGHVIAVEAYHLRDVVLRIYCWGQLRY